MRARTSAMPRMRCGRIGSLPRTIMPGDAVTSDRRAPLRSLYCMIRPTSDRRPGRADLLEETLVEGAHVARRVPGALGGGELAQSVDHARRVDVVGTARAAGLAGEAQPHRVVAEQRLAVVVRGEAHDVVRSQGHLAAHGAAGRAFAALIAAGDVDVGGAPHVRGKGLVRGRVRVVDRSARGVRLSSHEAAGGGPDARRRSGLTPLAPREESTLRSVTPVLISSNTCNSSQAVLRPVAGLSKGRPGARVGLQSVPARGPDSETGAAGEAAPAGWSPPSEGGTTESAAPPRPFCEAQGKLTVVTAQAGQLPSASSRCLLEPCARSRQSALCRPLFLATA